MYECEWQCEYVCVQSSELVFMIWSSSMKCVATRSLRRPQSRSETIMRVHSDGNFSTKITSSFQCGWYVELWRFVLSVYPANVTSTNGSIIASSPAVAVRRVHSPSIHHHSSASYSSILNPRSRPALLGSIRQARNALVQNYTAVRAHRAVPS